MMVEEKTDRERPTNEVIETLYSSEQDFGDDIVIAVSLDVMQGTYSNGYKTKPYLSLKITKIRDGRENKMYLRINDYPDSENELEWLFGAMNKAVRVDYVKKMTKYAKEWEQERDIEKARRIKEHEEFVSKKLAGQNKDSKVGTGLARFSQKSKSERKKERTRPTV